jgi:hypothetical protein
MRNVSVSLAAGLLILASSLPGRAKENEPKKKATLSNTQTLSFEPAGVIQLEQSFGDVEIEGWDRPEVEITTIRSSQKTYSEAERAEAEKDLDSIAITAIKRGEDHLKITTEFPPRNLKRPMRGKSNADLKYVIKAPAQAKIVVHHDMGEVKVSNFTNDIEVTNRIGEIGLRLPEPEAYAVDARVKIGDVSSDVGCSEGQNLVGQQLRSESDGSRRQLYLRVGIGDISIQKIRW